MTNPTYIISHPTLAGMKDIVKQIHDEKCIILSEVDLVSKRKYRKIQTMFKVGCGGCDSTDYRPTLCETYKEKALEVDVTELQTLIEGLRREMYPSMTGDEEMKEYCLKRGFGHDNGDDGQGNTSKNAKSI